MEASGPAVESSPELQAGGRVPGGRAAGEGGSSFSSRLEDHRPLRLGAVGTGTPVPREVAGPDFHYRCCLRSSGGCAKPGGPGGEAGAATGRFRGS